MKITEKKKKKQAFVRRVQSLDDEKLSFSHSWQKGTGFIQKKTPKSLLYT